MKIKIDKYGRLWIERAGRMKETICPYSIEEVACGDWCPQFGQIDVYCVGDGLWQYNIGTCGKTLVANEIIDERVPEESI